MKIFRYITLLCIIALSAMTGWAQSGFNPTSPSEPGATYNVKVVAQPAEAATVSGGGIYTVGKKVTISATAAGPEWRLTGWTDELGNDISTKTSFSYTTSNVNKVFTAHFERCATAQLTLSAWPSSACSANSFKGAGTQRVGESISVTAGQNSYYQFESWRTDDGTVVSTERSFTYVMPSADTHLTAYFRYTPNSPSEPTATKAKHAVYFTSTPCSASFNQSNGFQVTEGTSFSVRANAPANFTFSHWTLEGSDESIGTSSTYTATMGTADVRLVAHFRFTPGSPAEPNASSTERCTLYGLSGTVYRGQSTVYPIYLENTGVVKSLALRLVLPVGVTCDTEAISGTARTSGFGITATATPQADGTTWVDIALAGGAQIAGTNGKILDVPIAATVEAAIGDAIIDITEASAVMADDGHHAVTTRPGQLTIDILENLHAQFTFDRYMNRVQFTNTSSDECLTFTWDFGDGETSTLESPMHIYARPGTYPVRLTARGIAKESVAEQYIVINDPATWTAAGDYTLDPEAATVRNFVSLDEAITLLSQCTPTGDIVIHVADGLTDAFVADTDAAVERIAAFAARLQTAGVTVHFTAAEEHPAAIDFNLGTAPATSESLNALMAIIGQCQGTNVAITMCGIDVQPAALTAYREQTVCAEAPTAVVPLSEVSASQRVGVTWYATVAPDCPLTDFTTMGTGDIPSMTIRNTSAQAGTVDYHVTYTFDGIEFFSYIYKMSVRPILRYQTLTLSPADAAVVEFGNRQLQWTNLGTMASEGYTVWVEQTIPAEDDGEATVTERTIETSDYRTTITAVPGASYRWRVTAHGTCDDLESAINTFSVVEQADLKALSIEVPEVVGALQNITVTADVVNSGKGVTRTGYWTDALYYTTDPADYSLAVRIATTSHSGQLQPGMGYTASFTATIPNLELEQIYFFVRIDESDNEKESAEGNNVVFAAEPTLYNPVYIVDEDYTALKAFYSALNGEVWTRKWQTHKNYASTSKWPGVTFDSEGYVTAIDLSNNGLYGMLPAGSAFTFSRLATLRLDRNAISGDLADCVAGCAALRTLTMSHCLLTELTDVLPASITNLDLSYQCENADLTTIARQNWTIGVFDNVVLSSLVSYNHAAQDFSAHPDLRLYTIEGNSYVGSLTYDAGLEHYRLSASGDYRQASGAMFVVRPYNCPASDCRMRATLAWAMGDANADAAVDVLDAQHTLNYILGRHQGTFNRPAANTYADELINVQDVVATVGLFIDDEAPLAGSARRAAASEAPLAGALRTRADGLYLEADSPVAALDVVLSGVTADEVQLALRRSDFQMIVRNVAPASADVAAASPPAVRIVILSINGSTLPAADACIIRTARRATIEAIDASDADAQRLSLGVIGSAPTGIDALDADSDAPDAAPVYDLSGRRVYPERQSKGVSTVRSNGSTPSGIHIVGGRKVVH